MFVVAVALLLTENECVCMKYEGVMMKNGMVTSDSLHAAKKWLSELSENEERSANTFIRKW